jgi:secreted trypsin-like serine protease
VKNIFLTILGALALAFAFAMPAGAIVGGEVETELRPWMGSMQIDGNHGCGTTLVDSEWALTAFHCVEQWHADPATMEKVQLRFNTLIHKYGFVLLVLKYFHFPENPTLQGSDIALMKLSHPVDLTPALLPDASPAVGADVELIGWGITCEQSLPPLYYCGASPDLLHGVNVPLVDDVMCTSFLLGIAGPSELCLGNYFANKTACYGDSGGPALADGRVVGVTSRSGQTWLYGNCQIAPIIYTDVAFFRPWIDATIK